MVTQKTGSAHTPAAPERRWAGHPLGLLNLSAMEVWERFSFYGMQAILTFYIYYSVTQGGLGYPTRVAYSIVGAYGGVVYLASIVGSWLSDRWFGPARSVLGASVVIISGHVTLALIPGMAGLLIGLLCVALGSGTLKASALTLLGDLYADGDSAIDSGMSIYYMGINIGALVGPICTGYALRYSGFPAAFALAAVGMAMGALQYVLLRKKTIGEVGRTVPNPLTSVQKIIFVSVCLLVAALIAGAWALHILTFDNLSTAIIIGTSIAALIMFIQILSDKRITQVERRRVRAFIPLFFASALFWSLYQQQFTILPAIADRRLNLTFFGHTLPPSVVQSINPVFIILFAPLFAALWQWWGEHQPRSSVKFALGVFFCGLSFLVFTPFAAMSRIPFGAVVLLLFVATVGELFLSPTGNALATKLAPQLYHTQLVALFFLSIAIGTAASGSLATFADVDSAASTQHYFLILGIATMVIAGIFGLLCRWINNRMEGIH